MEFSETRNQSKSFLLLIFSSILSQSQKTNTLCVSPVSQEEASKLGELTRAWQVSPGSASLFFDQGHTQAEPAQLCTLGTILMFPTLGSSSSLDTEPWTGASLQ
jgi:hypothetical protein